MRDRIVVPAPFFGLGNGFGFGGTESFAVLIQKDFEKIANSAEFGRRQEIDESMGLLTLVM